ncbi:hypothetical protein Pmar_PMAR000871 [Perkinsus marinus ATCC 50983]|uniref:CUE domain-containing protein n=1 Tax=Perkinsus marinus (strain ATCC 50983 / TXsc) TaxID=423536 RepID=C5KXV5_PERM5|nr:hypothetical protein Pmar_PMAR000871 [Perkinsus marinus ATCC 50983]EER10829.1 hypothetical protein Pmar_PMAR000871 [Perkinsus marinus ATCC 50983]|eukprot:XP_002779034.1 hypothetical protein Pmar_PMAR000871 [Perkinsus marinus ATCC 50983]
MIPPRGSAGGASNEVLIASSPERTRLGASMLTSASPISQANPKRICRGAMQLDNSSSPSERLPVFNHVRPDTFEDNLAELQKRFPEIHRGIASSILETCGNSVSDAAISLKQLANASVGPVQGSSRAGKRRLETDEDDDDENGGIPSHMASASPLGGSTKVGIKRGHDTMVSEHSNLTGEQWAERLVLHLQGSPSLVTAKQRACEVLQAYERCVRERSAADSAGTKMEIEELQKKLHRHKTANKVLYRALHILNSRTNHCQDQVGLDSREDPAVVAELRKKLDETEAALRREKQTTDVLRYHLQQATSLNCMSLGAAGGSGGGGGGFGGGGVF